MPDENTIPGEWRLKPRQRGSQYEKSADWQPVESLDTEITCPQQGCDTRLKINPFVIKRAQGVSHDQS